jgi:hypothetical protein
MILLAAMSAIAALMLAATPALAQQGNLPAFREVDGFLIKPGDCGIGEQRFGGEQLSRAETLALRGVNEGNLPGGEGTPKFCVIAEDNNGNNNGNNNNDNNNVVVPVITQDFDQEAESGDIDQSFNVTGGGDNSNQTVGIQGVANTGNAQNQIGVIDADGFGNFDNNFDRRNDFCEDFRGDNFCDNNNDFCDVFDCNNNNNNRHDFCRFFDCNNNNDNDRFFDNNGDVEIQDSGASIDVSPTNTTTSNQQVNQAASASAPHHWVWTAWGWMWV